MSIFSINTGHSPSHSQQFRKESTLGSPHGQLSRQSSAYPLCTPLTTTMRRESKYLLDHYLHRTGRMASAHVGDYTPFTHSILPVANSSDMLLDAVLTFSSFHLSVRTSNFNAVDTLEQHALALRGLQSGVTKYSSGDRETGLQLFLSLLMLCCVEVCTFPAFGRRH